MFETAVNRLTMVGALPQIICAELIEYLYFAWKCALFSLVVMTKCVFFYHTTARTRCGKRVTSRFIIDHLKWVCVVWCGGSTDDGHVMMAPRGIYHLRSYPVIDCDRNYCVFAHSSLIIGLDVVSYANHWCIVHVTFSKLIVIMSSPFVSQYWRKTTHKKWSET